MVVRPLKGYRRFAAVLRSGRRATSGPLLFTAMPANDNGKTIYIGVGVPKRVAQKAVVRNRVKRLMRLALRSCLEECSTDFQGAQIVCLWRSAPEQPSLISLADVEHHMRRCVAKHTRSLGV